MYRTYLRRELAGRRKQTLIVAIGLAIAIALVIVVNALTAGVRDAQAQALASVYGVGTDLTVTGAAAEPGQGEGPRFDFDADAGESDGETTTLAQSTLRTDFLRGTLDSSVLDTVAATDGVSAASGALSLTNSTFSGEVPSGGFAPQDGEQPAAPEEGQTPPDGAAGGGGSFGVDSFSVLGIDPAATAVGPMASATVTDGRGLDADDAEALVAMVDSTYASTNGITVGDTIDVAGSDVEVIGILGSTSDSADTAANVYLPLRTAQTLAGVDDVISTVYVQADSAASIDAVQSALAEELPDATVTSQSELASTVSGSLSSATALITNLGTWLSVIVLAVALLLSVLLTLSGVGRRTREFGTLKAIGWSNGRVVRQVAGESMVQGLIGEPRASSWVSSASCSSTSCVPPSLRAGEAKQVLAAWAVARPEAGRCSRDSRRRTSCSRHLSRRGCCWPPSDSPCSAVSSPERLAAGGPPVSVPPRHCARSHDQVPGER